MHFFAVLTWRHSRQYIDALDRIEEIQRLRHGTGLNRDELLSVCEQVLQETPLVSTEEQKAITPDTARDFNQIEANQHSSDDRFLSPASMLRQMLKCQWLEEPKRSDYQRVYYLDSRAELLLDCLRRMAHPEQVNFTDKLHLVCTHLKDESTFSQRPLSDLEACNDNLRYGLQELRSMQQGMARLTQRQLRSESLKENLQVLYDDFSENIGQHCYKSLVSLDLPLRIPEVQQKLDSILKNPMIISQMEAELQKRRPELSPADLTKRVTEKLRETADMLESVEPQAQGVDRRAADFARRSFARFRYLQEVSSGRRSQIRELFEHINKQYAECKMAAMPEALDLPALKIPSVGLLAGLESLSKPRSNQKIESERVPLGQDVERSDTNIALSAMSETINNSLNALRANRYYQSLNVPSSGLNVADIPTDGEEWLLDIAGLLVNSETKESHYEITTPKEQGEETSQHRKEEYLIDDFTIHPST